MSRRASAAAIVLACLTAALLLRSCFGYDFVFRADGVNFQEGDAWFHMRTVQNLLHHFPRRSGFDPYSAFPNGQPIPTGPFFDYAIGLVAWAGGLGAPSPQLTDTIGAWFPAVLGAFITVPAYFLGRTLFNPAAGLWAAAIVATLPGLFLRVSLLGFTDHHVAEGLFSSLVLLFLVLALSHPERWSYRVCAGVALGCLLATRPAAAFVIGVVALWAILQCCLDHLADTTSRNVWLIAVPPLLIAWMIFLTVGDIMWGDFATLTLGAALLSITLAAALSHLLRNSPKWVYFGALGLATGEAIAVLSLARPELLRSLVHNVVGQARPGTARTVDELSPLLRRAGHLSLRPAWDEFAASWFLALPALFAAGRLSLRKNSPALTLFAVWSTVMLAATFLQYRMVYYLAVNIAVLAGAAVSWLLHELTEKRRLLAGTVLAGLVIGPNIPLAVKLASADTGPPEAWRESMAWLREKTPEPMGDSKAFDGYYPRLARGARFSYPRSAYGIMNWWDHGHWISAMGRRIPVANPMQTGATEAARFFTATEPARAVQVLQQTGARYVITDSSLPMIEADTAPDWLGSFWAMPVWAAEKMTDYLELYRSTDPARTQPVLVFYPAYYRSMLARLYLYNGEAVQPYYSTWVIQYRQATTTRGTQMREIVSTKPFPTYTDAELYIEAHPGELLVLGGLNSTRSCVPVEKLDGFRAVYASAPNFPGAGFQGNVKIFEYVGP